MREPALSAALRALIELGPDWHPVQTIADACPGPGRDRWIDELAQADVLGLVHVRLAGDGASACLSPLGAHHLGLEIRERKDRYYWAHKGEPFGRAYERHTRGQVGLRGSEDPALAVDRDDPAALAVAGELDGPGKAKPPKYKPRPTQLVGTSLSPYREMRGMHLEELVPAAEAAGEGAARCPACRGGPLRPCAYCLCCSASGRDRPSKPAPEAARERRRPTPRRNPAAGGLPFTDGRAA